MTTFPNYARARRGAGTFALGRLSVPVATGPRGAIPISELVNPVVVEVPKSVDMKNTDSIKLYRDGVETTIIYDLSGVNLADPAITKFDLPIPVADFPPAGQDTIVKLDYYVYDTPSEDGQLSNLPVDIRFDRLAPGGDKLPPLVFSDGQLSGITLSDLVNGELILKIDPYFDGESADKIELWLGTSPTTGSYLGTEFPVADPTLVLPVGFAEADLRAAGDGTLYFGYRSTDWAGNVSGLSELVPVVVFLDLPDLDPPEVPKANDGLITWNDATPDPVGVVIPHYDGAAPGDLIYVVWDGQRIAPYPLPSPVPVAPDPVAEILVPLNVIKNGTAVPVSYIVQRVGFPEVPSPSTPVNVDLTTPGGTDPDPDPETPEHEYIKPPEIKCGTSPVDTIQAPDYGKDATATIFRARTLDNQPIWEIDDVIQLYWGTVGDPEIPPVRITATNEPANISIPVPFTDVIEFMGTGDIDVYFTVTRVLDGTNSVTIPSPKKKVSVVASGQLPGDGNPIDKASFPEANASNIITRAVGIRGTRFEIELSGISNIDLAKNPKISYNFVGVASGDATVPGSALPIEASRLTGTDVPITQAMLDQGYFEAPLPYSLTYPICRNGATLDYSLSNDFGTTNGIQKFVRFAMNQGGGAVRFLNVTKCICICIKASAHFT